MAKQENKKQPEGKKPKFNSYWIYAGIILIFLGINFFSGSGFNEPAKTNIAEFESFLKDGDVKKVVVINKRTANVYLTEKAAQKPKHEKSKQKEFLPAGETPDYTFELGDLQNFENDFDELKNEYNLDTIRVNETHSDVW